MNKNKKKERGEKGYLSWKKRAVLLHTVILVLIGLGIFVLGLLLNKMEATNIFTIFAVLMVLPAAKSLTTVILLAPYQPVPVEVADRLFGYAKEGDSVYYDVVFTSAEKAMHLDMIYVTGHQIIGYSSRSKDKLNDIKAYFEKELANRAISYTVFLTAEETALKKRMNLRQEREEAELSENTPAKQEVLAMLMAFIV